jgi:outer membrane biosynthesis protein TonB
MDLTQLRPIENQIKSRSVGLTALVVGILVGLLFIPFTLIEIKLPIPPDPEERFVTVGRIDFGNYTNGSQNINTFEPPRPNPVKNQPVKAETPPKVKTPVKAAEPLTQEEKSEVAEPAKPEPKPTPKPVPQPTPAPTPRNSSPTSSGGSNHGDAASGTGNRGTPKSKVLDDNGLYTLGDGIAAEGLGNRGLINEFRPMSCGDCGESGKIVFVVTIAPDGRVIQVRTKRDPGVPKSKPLLISALKRLRFDPIPAGESNQEVTITVNVKAE